MSPNNKTDVFLQTLPGEDDSRLKTRERSGWTRLRYMSHRTTKPTKLHVRPAKTLIRLGGCPGLSESSTGAHVSLLVLSCGGSYHVAWNQIILNIYFFFFSGYKWEMTVNDFFSVYLFFLVQAVKLHIEQNYLLTVFGCQNVTGYASALTTT